MHRNCTKIHSIDLSIMLHAQFSMSGRVGVNVPPLVVDRATVHGSNLGDNSVVSFSSDHTVPFACGVT